MHPAVNRKVGGSSPLRVGTFLYKMFTLNFFIYSTIVYLHFKSEEMRDTCVVSLCQQVTLPITKHRVKVRDQRGHKLRHEPVGVKNAQTKTGKY